MSAKNAQNSDIKKADKQVSDAIKLGLEQKQEPKPAPVVDKTDVKQYRDTNQILAKLQENLFNEVRYIRNSIVDLAVSHKRESEKSRGEFAASLKEISEGLRSLQFDHQLGRVHQSKVEELIKKFIEQLQNSTKLDPKVNETISNFLKEIENLEVKKDNTEPKPAPVTEKKTEPVYVEQHKPDQIVETFTETHEIKCECGWSDDKKEKQPKDSKSNIGYENTLMINNWLGIRKNYSATNITNTSFSEYTGYGKYKFILITTVVFTKK